MAGLRHAFEAIIELPPAERHAGIDALALSAHEARLLRAMVDADDAQNLGTSGGGIRLVQPG